MSTSNLKKPITNSCLYYGYPSSFSGTYKVEDCATLFAKYDLVVWGDRYQDPSHQDYSNAVAIAKSMLNKNSTMEFLGYIPIGMDNSAGSNLKMNELKSRVYAWKTLGCTGIFLDEFGFDYRVTRERQNEIVNYIHTLSMNVIANSWRIDYAFSSKSMPLSWLSNFDGNPNKLLPVLNENDYYMFENAWYEWNSDTTQTEVKYAEGSLPKNRMYEAIDYYQKAQTDYGGLSYYEKFKTKTFALDGVSKELLDETKEKYFMTGMMASLLMNIDTYCMSTDSWGARGKYHKFNQPDYYELYKPNKHVIKAAKKYSSFDDVFTAVIGTNTLELTWVQDAARPENPELGIHKVTWNGQLVDSFNFVMESPPEIPENPDISKPCIIDSVESDPLKPEVGQIWLRSDSTSDHPLRIMTVDGIKGIRLVDPIDNSPTIEKKIVLDGLAGYWNAKQGLTTGTWKNIAPATIGSHNAINKDIVVDEKGAKFNSTLLSRVDIPHANSLTNTTLEFFFTHNTISHEGHWLFGTSSGNRLVIYGNNKPNFKQVVAGKSVSTSPNIVLAAGTLNHIAIRIAGTTTDVFVNGVKIPVAVPTGLFEWRQKIFLGTYSGSEYKFDGYLHSFKLYNRALTDLEIEQNRAVGIDIGL
ncbi:LamG domain-containing protein [Solibacillus sp. FSL K6-1523]|uniref:LamG domain-containing protein n=1 Tax=Solibacillus sp. FSL K6-1523 TaxID=2921471 RepID=UPI0030FB2338